MIMEDIEDIEYNLFENESILSLTSVDSQW